VREEYRTPARAAGVNSRPPKTAQFLGFSRPNGGQRDSRHRRLGGGRDSNSR
jgi:hypothetical protein